MRAEGLQRARKEEAVKGKIKIEPTGWKVEGWKDGLSTKRGALLRLAGELCG